MNAPALDRLQTQVKLSFQRIGKGEPLLILHGLLGSSDNWRQMSRRLGRRFDVFAIDLRNHGASPHEPLMDYRLMADDIYQFLHIQSIADVAIIGHSMGGKVAMQFALTRPEQVKQLVVVDITPFQYGPRHKNILDALQAIDLQKISSRKEADKILAQKIPELRIRQFLLKNLARESGKRYKWKMNLASIIKNYPSLNDAVPADGTYEGPALLVRGDQSDYVSDDDFLRIKQWFPSAELMTIAGAGHWVHAERPDEFFRIVHQFLTR